uniref:Selectin P n=1 Tax=Salarias fasciatus TaxID=181472 RepID=A0A672HMI0_SALFA
IFLVETALGWTYHFSDRTMNWTVARQWCQANFKDMVVIQNQRENDYVVSLLPNRTKSPYYWIGITKNHKNETWTWIGNNSTWIGEHSWAPNEPNNNHSTEFCVEIYVNYKSNRGQWNDEKCGNKKYAVCYKAQCHAASCERGRCQETIKNTTCLCEPGFSGDRCQNVTICFLCFLCQIKVHIQNTGRNASISMFKIILLFSKRERYLRCYITELPFNLFVSSAVECPPLSRPDNGHLSCSDKLQIFNTTCQFTCEPGFLITGSSTVTCGSSGGWSGPMPSCKSNNKIPSSDVYA